MTKFLGEKAKDVWKEAPWHLGASCLGEAEHLRIVASQIPTSSSLSRLSYWTSEVYGFGKILRAYGIYPPFLPLFFDTDHGPQLCYKPLLTEIQTKSPLILLHNKNAREQWIDIRLKKSRVVSSPFVIYRKRKKINRNPASQGLLFFPAHSTTEVEERTSLNQYIELLSQAPDSFGPVAVCMYSNDVVLNKHLPFLEAGIPVFTAGAPMNARFAENFYDIIRHFNFSASNEIGSYTFYSVEMEIPFSYRGPRPTYWNRGDVNEPIGFVPDRQGVAQIQSLFDGWNKKITSQQRQFALSLLGQDSVPSRIQVSVWMYSALFSAVAKKIKSLLRGGKRGG